MRILVTGGAGFIGHHFIEHLLKKTDWEIVVLDSLTYAANGLDRLRDISAFDDKRVSVLTADFTLPLSIGTIEEIGLIDYLVHMGAETHVDNSIRDPKPFIMSNVVGTMNMLEYARMMPKLKRFIYFSTDEIFGPAPEGVFYKEWDRYNSTNPYSASKAGGEELCLAYANTYKVPIVITHTMNVFGERQHPEKFIPLVIDHVLNNKVLSIHSDSTKTIPGSRHWIHARNVADAVLFLLENSEIREKYNIVGEKEVNNLEMAEFIADILNERLQYEMVDFHSSRPGHDLRYALDGTKLKEMGYKYPSNFEGSLEKTILWSIRKDNEKWVKKNEEVLV